MKLAVALVLTLLLTHVPIAPAAQQTTRPRGPKLVVLLSIDQMRGDYIDRYQHQWTKGLKRLVTEGAWFRQADYPYYNTVTCAGHASISTGTVPAVHGMVLNQWWERNNSRQVSCTDDEQQKLITYGIPVQGVGHSARNLMTQHAGRRDAAAGIACAARGEHLAQGAFGNHARRSQARRRDLAGRGRWRMGHVHGIRECADVVLRQLHCPPSAAWRDGPPLGAIVAAQSVRV